MTLEQLEEYISKENPRAYRPVEQDGLLKCYLTLLICKELRALKESVDALKVETQKEPVKEPGKPGRKKIDKEVE